MTSVIKEIENSIVKGNKYNSTNIYVPTGENPLNICTGDKNKRMFSHLVIFLFSRQCNVEIN